MSLINDALKKAQNAQASNGSGARSAYHPASSKGGASAEPISNVMPEIKSSGRRMGTMLVVAGLGIVTLGGAGYMFFLRSDNAPVVVQRRPAVAPAATPPTVASKPASETAVVESSAEPQPAPTPDSFFRRPAEAAAPATAVVEEPAIASTPAPVEEPDLIAAEEPAPPAPASEIESDPEAVAPGEEAVTAIEEATPPNPIEEPEPVVAAIETPDLPEPEPAPAIVSPVAGAPDTAAEKPVVAEPVPATPVEVASTPPVPEPQPAPAVVETAVAAPALRAKPTPPPAPQPEPVAATPAPPPEPVTPADPEIQLWVDSIKVAGMRMGPVPKILMNDRVYAQGEMVQFDYEIRLIEITENLLKFKDPKGHIYYYRL